MMLPYPSSAAGGTIGDVEGVSAGISGTVTFGRRGAGAAGAAVVGPRVCRFIFFVTGGGVGRGVGFLVGYSVGGARPTSTLRFVGDSDTGGSPFRKSGSGVGSPSG